MFVSKRRPASTQAVSRKVEGIQPRNTRTRKDDDVMSAEVNTSTTAKARMCRFLGVKDHGMRDIETTRQPGRSCRCFRRNLSYEAGVFESMPNNRTKGGRQNQGQGVGSSIVPAKAGNAAGGKETTDGRPK